MHLLPARTLAMLATARLVAATEPRLCVQACREAFNHVAFEVDASMSEPLNNVCGNSLRIQSIYLCLKSYCSDLVIGAGSADLLDVCEGYQNITLFALSNISNVSDSDTANLLQFTAEAISREEIHNTSLRLPPNLWQLALRSVQVRNDSLRKRETYAEHSPGCSQLRLAVEGPYGHSVTLELYDAALLVAGGTGIAVALSYLQAVAESISTPASKTTTLSMVHLVWVL
ncbi:hypothetical protein BDV24DRAFT_169302 [Aspergillus arachidicola]|uniref:Ferric reductase NAD binding domain-containing protein n=1 Tax=Aspergillus arachidicola TaxID=656916 RepID=A0A5N6XT36_9EURO|nr:hypothetical protein BDV24DRAFT_169302 [Aspergillus arachidicola]